MLGFEYSQSRNYCMLESTVERRLQSYNQDDTELPLNNWRSESVCSPYLCCHTKCTHLIHHRSKRQSSENDVIINAIPPATRRGALHQHIVEQRRIERDTCKHYLEVVSAAVCRIIILNFHVWSSTWIWLCTLAPPRNTFNAQNLSVGRYSLLTFWWSESRGESCTGLIVRIRHTSTGFVNGILNSGSATRVRLGAMRARDPSAYMLL